MIGELKEMQVNKVKPEQATQVYISYSINEIPVRVEGRGREKGHLFLCLQLKATSSR